jgi:MFS family permease
MGALAAGIPAVLASRYGWSELAAERSVFFVYSGAALLMAAVYLGLPPAPGASRERPRPLARSRGTVLKLAALFSIDSFGGGLVLQTLVALWFYRRFGLGLETVAAFFFVTNLVAASSQLVASWLAPRWGLVRTMVLTHLPANLFLIAAAFMPTPALAMTFLFMRACLSNMDVPVRQALVMAVVPAEERPAAASVTNVPRSLATAGAPILAGVLMEKADFAWAIVAAGALKAAYDVGLYFFGRTLRLEQD